MLLNQEPIIALATPMGTSAIAVLRLSGKNVISLVNQVFKGKDLTKQASHTLHFGTILDGTELIDEVLIALFVSPHSFTKEDSIEIFCHGSPFIIQRLIQLFLKQGVRMAQAGEFTKRAFLNGRFDLTQAEAVADLIAADSTLSQQTALNQMRGGFSSKLKTLRSQLTHFLAMLELELDFSEEDVTFTDPKQLQTLAHTLIKELTTLLESFRLGNVIKNGIPVTIIGAPNAGKSTLLNHILQEERAIVSSIAGTTRDPIEGQLHLGGLLFRFTDTAGLRTNVLDEIETIGIERTKQALSKASIILYTIDLSCMTFHEAEEALKPFNTKHALLLKIGNKVDIAPKNILESFKNQDYLLISAKSDNDINHLKAKILAFVQKNQIHTPNSIFVNMRHYEQLKICKQAMQDVIKGLENNLSNELLAIDLHKAIYALGTITGEITTEDILEEIFSKFCIGK